jgi:hypothetical protein
MTTLLYVLASSGTDWSSPFGYQPMPGPWTAHGYDTHWLQSPDVFFVLMLVTYWLNAQHLRGSGHYLGEKAAARAFRWLLRRPETTEAPHPPVTVDGALHDGSAAVTEMPA